MADQFDMAMDDAEGEDEADSIYNQICAEQGIALESGAMGGV